MLPSRDPEARCSFGLAGEPEGELLTAQHDSFRCAHFDNAVMATAPC